MAELCTEKAVHPELKSLCQNIISSQTEQKGQLQGWLQSWYGGKGTAPEEMKAKMQTMQTGDDVQAQRCPRERI